MPTNPFQGIGSRGGASEIASQTRAVKAYDQARKRLLSTMASEEKAAAGVAAAHTAAMQKRSRDHAAYESELKNTSNLLKSQGEVLKNLDLQRSRYHNEEMKRSDSLLKRYEGIKVALREIQEDGGNTSTVLGAIFQPFSAGIANMQKFGELPKVTRAIKDVNLSLRDVSGSADRVGSALEATGAAMLEVSGSVWKYRTAVDELNVGLAALKVKYADATDGTQKLADQFVNLSKMDLVKEGAVDTVVEVTDAIKRLEAQGVNAEEALSTLAERSLTSGRSFLETAEDLREVTATADILTERINNSESALKGFAFTTRDDLVRAIADATRNLDSQVVSLDNVAASYAYAQEQAARYGLSVKGSQKVAKAFTGALFRERQDAPAMLAGLEMQRNLSKALRDAEKAMSEEEGREIEYGKASEEQQRILRRQAYSAIGIEQTDENDLAMRQGIDTLGEGLGAVDLRNLFAGTVTAIKADIDAKMKGLNLREMDDTSVLHRLLGDIDGLDNLDVSQRRVYADMLRNGNSGEVAEAIQKLQEEAAERAADEENLQSSALTAVLTFKDPIQQLFNIKDYIKAIALNVSNIVKMIGGVVGVNLNSLLPDLTRDIVAEERSPEVLASMREASNTERQEMLKGVIDAQKALREADSEAQRSEAQKRLDNAQKELKRVEDARLELENSEYRRSEILGRRYSPPTSTQESEEEESPSPSFFSSERSAARERDAISALASISGTLLGPQISENIESAAHQFIDAGYRSSIQRERERSSAPGLGDMSSSSSRAASSRSPAQTTQPGEVEAVGEGSVSVNTSGETIANVQIKFKNMGEAVAYHNSDTARLLNQHGLA